MLTARFRSSLQVRKFEAQQARLELLEHELEAMRESKQQAISSRAETVKQLEEERGRTNSLEKLLDDTKSKLARAQRQIELLKSPTGQLPLEEADPDKPRPMHERVQQDMARREEKKAAILAAAGGNRTYAPAIDPNSSSIAKKSVVRTASAPGAATSKPAGVSATSPAAARAAVAKGEGQGSAVAAQAAQDATLSSEDRHVVKELRAQMNKDQVELSTERRLRETAEAAASKAVAAEKNALERRAEIETTLQRMTTKEREQTNELQNAVKRAKEATSEVDSLRRLTEAAQADAAVKAAEAQRLSRERGSWVTERERVRAERDEALAQAAEQSERSENAEKALKEIAGAAPSSGAQVASSRQSRGGKDHPNAEAVQKQQQKAKIEKARLQVEEEKRARAKVERELSRAHNELSRVQTLLENAASAECGEEGRKSAADAVKDMAAEKRATGNALAVSDARSSGGGDRAGGRNTKRGNAQMSVTEMQRHLRVEAEEAVLLRELKEMDEELSSARSIAGIASTRVIAEQAALVRELQEVERGAGIASSMGRLFAELVDAGSGRTFAPNASLYSR